VKLQCKVVDCNPEEAFVRNIVENNERAATTPVDDAHNQRRLREEFGWTEQRIADFYKRSVAYISQLRKTLQLPQPIQQAVAGGKLAVSAAIDLVELPEAARQQAVAEATDRATGKVDSEVIRKKVRDRKIESGQAKARTLKEVRTFFEEQHGPGPIRELAESILDFLAGKITDSQMRHALENVCQFPACEPAAHS
jgi:ParB-like chromosome segregation protein Spo0J